MEESQWYSNIRLMSKIGQYHGTTSIDLILTFCWCQIANIIWTSTHVVNTMPRMCLEIDHWQKNVKTCGRKTFGLKTCFYFANIRHQFDANSWSWCRWSWCRQLTSQKLSFLTYGWLSVDVNCWHHLDVNSILFWKKEYTISSLNNLCLP